MSRFFVKAGVRGRAIYLGQHKASGVVLLLQHVEACNPRLQHTAAGIGERRPLKGLDVFRLDMDKNVNDMHGNSLGPSTGTLQAGAGFGGVVIASIIPGMVPLQVRPGDCDSFGHVNNAVYVGYVQQAIACTLAGVGLAADWQPGGDHSWQVRSLSADYRYATCFGEPLAAHLWLENADPLQPVFGCEIRSADTDLAGVEQVKVRTRSAWVRLARAGGEPTPVPADVLVALPTQAGVAPKPFTAPSDPPNVRSYGWQRHSMRSESDPFGHVHLPAIYHWLEEAIFDASAQAGWPMERWQAEGYFVLQARHDTLFVDHPRFDENTRITSRLIDIRRLRGTWCVELRRHPSNDLLVRDYSTGVFLDLAGRPASLPARIGREIQFGAEPRPDQDSHASPPPL